MCVWGTAQLVWQCFMADVCQSLTVPTQKEVLQINHEHGEVVGDLLLFRENLKQQWNNGKTSAPVRSHSPRVSCAFINTLLHSCLRELLGVFAYSAPKSHIQLLCMFPLRVFFAASGSPQRHWFIFRTCTGGHQLY